MVTLNAFTNGFAGKPCTVPGKTPRLCRWVYFQPHFGGVTIFEDGHMKEFGPTVRAWRKVGWLNEPRELKPENYEWAEQNAGLFDRILTHDQRLLDSDPDKFYFMLNAGVWIPRDQWGLPAKSRSVGMFLSDKRQTAGHRFRAQVAETVPGIDVYRGVYGQAKIDLMKQYRFWVVVENAFEANYFTEALLDPLAVGCVPIYYYPEPMDSGNYPVQRFILGPSMIAAPSKASLEIVVRNANENPDHHYTAYRRWLLENLDCLPDLEIPEDWMVQNAIADYVQ